MVVVSFVVNIIVVLFVEYFYLEVKEDKGDKEVKDDSLD